jgi:hypothetical protein
MVMPGQLTSLDMVVFIMMMKLSLLAQRTIWTTLWPTFAISLLVVNHQKT